MNRIELIGSVYQYQQFQAYANKDHLFVPEI